MRRSKNVRRISRSRKSNRKVVRKSKRRVVEKSKRRTNHKKRRINSKRRKKRTLKIKGGNPRFTRRSRASSSWTPEPKFIHIKQKRKIQKSFDDQIMVRMGGKVEAGTKCLMLARGKPESDSKRKILILVGTGMRLDKYEYTDFGLVIINGTEKKMFGEDKSYMDDCTDFPFELLEHNWDEMAQSARGRGGVEFLRSVRESEKSGEGVVHKYEKSRLDKMYRNLEGLNPENEKYSEIGNIKEIKEKALKYIRDVLNPNESPLSHFDNPKREPFTRKQKEAIKKEIATMEAQQRVLPWCTKGSIAKYEGKLGEVQGKPNRHFQVKLRWANGVESEQITALHLTQATDSEAEEFKQQQQQQQQQVAEQVLTLQRKEEIEVNSEPTGNPSIRASNAESDAIRLQQSEEEEVKSLPEKYSKLTKLNCVVGLPIISMFERKNGERKNGERKNGVIKEYAEGETATVMFDDGTASKKFLSELFVNEQELVNGLHRRSRDRRPLTKEATDAAGLADMSVDV